MALLPVPAASREGARSPERRGGGRDRVSALRLSLTQGQVSVKLCQSTAAASLGRFRVQLCVRSGVGSSPVAFCGGPAAAVGRKPAGRFFSVLSWKEVKCSSASELALRSLDAMAILDVFFLTVTKFVVLIERF